tara:strand:- start:4331 stop:5314 length:984 start_codon:yes stop_codon:yes gene_type:complete
MRKILPITLAILTISACTKETQITNFKECADAGNPVMESYPRQCRTPDGKTFVENIGNELDKSELIRIDKPRPNSLIESSFEIEGSARGYWFFEGSFPIVLEDSEGNILAKHFATAQAEWPAGHSPNGEGWMTEKFVQFKAELEVDFGDATSGFLVLKKDNPSDLPENNDELRVPLMFDSKLDTWSRMVKKLSEKLELSDMNISETSTIPEDQSDEIEVGSHIYNLLNTLETRYISPNGWNTLLISASDSPDKEVFIIDRDNNYRRVLFCGTPCEWSEGGWISDDIFFVTGINADVENSTDHRPVLYIFDLDSNTIKTYNGSVISQL